MSPIPLYISPLQKDRVLGMAISFLLHSALFIGGGMILISPAQFAVEVGSGGMEINLIAAPSGEALPTAAVEKQPSVPDPDAVALTEQTPEAKKQTATNLSGKDAVTFHSSGGALTEAAPNYLRNPAPTYPWEARQNQWEGVVMLKAFVDSSGRAVRVEREQTSGYEILDQAALKAVKSWRFKPARLGELPVESTVMIPVRFELGKQDR